MGVFQSAFVRAAGMGAKNMGMGIAQSTAAAGSLLYGIGKGIHSLPWQVSVPSAAILGVAISSQSKSPSYQLSQSMAPMPSSNPGYYPAGNSNDLGASGDLVLALNKLRH